MNEKADKYFGALHPEYETLTPEEKSKLIRDRVFIRDHIEEIKSWYEEAVGHGAKEGDPRIIEEAIRMAKSKMYIKMLYPDYSKLNLADRQTMANDSFFIQNHVKEIESWYEEAVGHGAKEGDPSIIEEAIRMAKSKMYIKMLYPDYSKLNLADRQTMANDSFFIQNHVKEIESWYEEAVGHGAKEGDPSIIEEAIRIIKRKTKQITPQQIGNATKYAPIKAKTEAAQVESDKGTQEKGGEKLRYGN